jgi:L-asparaginase/Glu-tRNA(Gln) amidotransferase subunit D
MAKKEEKFSFKKVLGRFMEKSIQSIISVVAEQSDQIVAWIKNISGMKRRIRRLFIALSFCTAGLVVLGMGLGSYISELLPSLRNGIAHILVGIVLMLIAAVYMNLKE